MSSLLFGPASPDKRVEMASLMFFTAAKPQVESSHLLSQNLRQTTAPASLMVTTTSQKVFSSIIADLTPKELLQDMSSVLVFPTPHSHSATL
ncbi:hypothetical protein TWF506_005995 [Arthrobotrys conoides]|uniref:Uncharacterized protein n=1 Tax=Arthrobotrys conoides TaxID=74498 RepID=A0AAN8NQ68_9PEZI